MLISVAAPKQCSHPVGPPRADLPALPEPLGRLRLCHAAARAWGAQLPPGGAAAAHGCGLDGVHHLPLAGEEHCHRHPAEAWSVWRQVALNIATVAFCCHIFQQAESFVNWWRSFRIWHEHLWAWRTSKIWSFQLCDRLAARVGSFHLLKRRCESFWQPCSSQEISGNSLGGMNQSAGPATRKNMACQFSSISD